MKNGFKIAIFYIVLIGIILIATASLWNSIPQDKLNYSNVVDYFVNEQRVRHTPHISCAVSICS